MKVIEDGLYLCADCTLVACNGSHGVDIGAEQLKATLDGLAALGPYLVPSFNSETGEGLEDFSRTECAACHTSLTGYRAEFAILGEDGIV